MKLKSFFSGQLPSHIIFDLDGTLVDSIPDIAASVDEMLGNLGRKPAGEHRVRAWVGNGTPMLIRRALAGSLDDAAADQLPEETRNKALDQFMAIYRRRNGEKTQVYEGVIPFLQTMAKAEVKMAVVTNKLACFTEQLLERTDLAQWFGSAVGGDTLTAMKPAPEPLHHALAELGGPVRQALMIGDSETDIKSARAAGIPCIAVTYGYNHGKPIQSQGADLVVDSLTELL